MGDEALSQGGTGESTLGVGGLSVPLGVHFAELRAADHRFLQERDRRYAAEREGDKLAVDVALARADELAAKHNDLIHASEKRDSLFATKDEVGLIRSTQAKMVGGLIVLGAIGLTNLIRLWT